MARLIQKFGNYQDDIDTQLSGLWGTFKDFESLFTVAFSANKITFTYFAGRIELGGSFVLNSGNGSILSRIQGRIDQEVFFKDAPTPYTRYELTEVDRDFQDIFSKTWSDILSGDDFIEGGRYTDFRLSSYWGNDTIIAGGGSDVIDGGQGRDTVIFSGQRSGFTLVINEDSATLRSSELSNDSISLRNIERLSFSDSAVALDFDPGDSSYNTVMMIGAAFGKALVPTYFGVGVSLFDRGATKAEIAKTIVDLKLIESTIGTEDTTAWINHVYKNLVGVAPDPSSLGLVSNLLETGAYTRASLLAFAADLPLLETQVGITGLQTNGLAYTPIG
jgi:Ca2+-binding RTX toxin-like protein